MSRTQGILERFAGFFKTWDNRSRLFRVAAALGKRLDEADKDLTKILRAHWVDTAFGQDLNQIGAIFNLKRTPVESDSEYRNRLKRAIAEFKGGGTVSAVLTSVRMLLGLPKDYPIQLTENPSAEASRTVEVRTGDTWVMSSNSVLDAVPSVMLSVETANAKVTNPTITNLDIHEAVTFNGLIRSGETLKVQEGKAFLGRTNVTKSMSSSKVPRLLRKGSEWSYTELLEEQIGIFDRAAFDESVFAVGIPTAKLTFTWTAYQPATFEVRIPREAVSEKGRLSAVQDAVDSIRAAGVRAVVKVTEG